MFDALHKVMQVFILSNQLVKHLISQLNKPPCEPLSKPLSAFAAATERCGAVWSGVGRLGLSVHSLLVKIWAGA